MGSEATTPQPDTPSTTTRVAKGVQVNASGQVLRAGEIVHVRDPEVRARWLRLGWLVES
jgi:hypothetical protein